ncbi:serine hydrolase domain-containing protein [Paenibacillus thalictri]|uniref:Class C beta-lactamase-related serine hydrolase n=1 Tax=Paenibacillus thalictri TaxID=2527873 RepID=A0A4Q9DGI2_9BACL|nr:serine hydrolase [Paenibacillus thalictri]TBL69396.1 class C beta-lactamase-related serine hydrolase [Paenibacillus thalictri]
MNHLTIKKRRMLSTAAYCSALALLLTACGDKPVDPRFYNNAAVVKKVSSAKAPDYWPTAGWKTTTPEQQGMNPQALAQFVDGLNGNNVHSFVVVRNGYIVAEGYNSMVDANTKQEVKSVTKSITSAMIGVAVGDKKISGVDKTVGDYFPDTAADSVKSHITLAQLMIMRSGLAWDNTREKATYEMMASPSWEQYILSQPMVSQPGTGYNYSNGNAHLMSIVLEKSTGEKLQNYAETRLFTPLGIKDASWEQDPQGHTNGAFGLKLTVRDMAKIGLLYLQDGKWSGKEVIPKKWVEQTISKDKDRQYDDGTLGGYGYFWWMKKLSTQVEEGLDSDVFYANGSEGQRIFVIPEENLIVAMTSNNTKEELMPEKQLISAVKAIESNKAVKSDPAGTENLNKSIQAFKVTADK